MAWSSGPVASSLLRVREIQGSIPLKRTSFLNLVWMIETCCIINWHFEFIYKFCGHHSTLGKPPVPSSTIQRQQHGSTSSTSSTRSISSALPSITSKHCITYLCFHSETDSSNNCGYVVLNQRLRLRKGVKDSLKNSHRWVASKLGPRPT